MCMCMCVRVYIFIYVFIYVFESILHNIAFVIFLVAAPPMNQNGCVCPDIIISLKLIFASVYSIT